MSGIEQRTDQLFSELVQVHYEISQRVRFLINAKWDSPTLKAEIESLISQFDQIEFEITTLEKRGGLA